MSKPLDSLDKLHSRLRHVANGSSLVNSVRAQQHGAVRLTVTPDTAELPNLDAVTQELQASSSPVVAEAPERERQKVLADDVEVNVFVLFNRDRAGAADMRRSGRIGSTTVLLSELHRFEDDPSVQAVELAETLRPPDPLIGAASVGAPPSGRFDRLNSGAISYGDGRTRALEGVGEDILVGIIDVGGIDFAHPDFMDDAGNTRIVGIWDQGGDAFPPPDFSALAPADRPSPPLEYGSEITAGDIGIALQQARDSRASPYDFAPQSQQTPQSHATHVASIAAGRRGVARCAKIGAVMISLPADSLDRLDSFYDTTRLVDGLTYLFALAEREGLKGVSVNISLGTNGGPHDASELMSRWIDRALADTGRALCVAAGNSGLDQPRFEGDTGFWSGRVHASGRIAATGLRRDLEWVVVGNGLQDISENELEIWYGAADEFVVELFAPDGHRLGPVGPGERIENQVLPDQAVVSIYNYLSDPKNGDNRISIFLSPFMAAPIIPIGAGTWRVRLTGKVIRGGRFNAWIERDDPGQGPVRSLWRLPSFFGPNTYVDDSTLSSLACGPRVIGVANYDEATEVMNRSSSQGPTRDGRQKPEIAAPGTNIIAACGFHPQRQWVGMTGTSMASPHVAGLAALMLSLNPKLTAAQIGGIVQRTSQPLPGSTFDWQNSAGFGIIDAYACLREALRISEPIKEVAAASGEKR